MNEPKTTRQIVKRNSAPVRFRLMGKDGRQRAIFKYAQTAAEYATRIWPDQKQDENNEGRGWYIERTPES